MRPFVQSLAAALALFVAPSAFAQPKPTVAGDDYSYRFDDDHMVGDTLSTTPPLLRIRTRGVRVQLIRPRASFVAEMFKSVEVL